MQLHGKCCYYNVNNFSRITLFCPLSFLSFCLKSLQFGPPGTKYTRPSSFENRFNTRKQTSFALGGFLGRLAVFKALGLSQCHLFYSICTYRWLKNNKMPWVHFTGMNGRFLLFAGRGNSCFGSSCKVDFSRSDAELLRPYRFWCFINSGRTAFKDYER